MRKGSLILVIGLVLGVLAFCGFYYAGTAPTREMLSQPHPELAWLKKEFHVTDEEFVRISKLHDAYLPDCAKRCEIIAAQNQTLERLLNESSTVTPGIQDLLEARARTRAECEAAMLKHFYEVSHTMPPEEGKRYLEWVQSQTCLAKQGMETRHGDMSEHMSEPAQ